MDCRHRRWPIFSKATLDDGVAMPLDYADALTACASLDAVCGVFRKQVAREGYTASACRAISLTEKGRAMRFFFRNCPPGWPHVSDKRNFSAKSFVLAEARRRMTPFSWHEARQARTPTAAEQE